jgi:hypothetical protein
MDFFSKLLGIDRARLLVSYGFQGGILNDYNRFYGKYWPYLMQDALGDTHITNMRSILEQMAKDYAQNEITSAEDWINKRSIPDWTTQNYEDKLRYYILKYPDFINASGVACFYIYDANLAYGDFAAMGSECSWASYNKDPFIFILNSKMKLWEKNDFKGLDYRWSGKPHVCFKDEIEFYTREFHWFVTSAKYQTQFDTLMQTDEDKNKDLIEQGEMIIELCRALIP